MKSPITNPTSTYRSSGWGPASAAAWNRTGEPVFSWNEIPLMELDGAVEFGLRTLRTPYQQIDVASDQQGQPKISGRPEVKDFILRTWRRFWRLSLGMLLERYFKWGRGVGGAEWRFDNTNNRLELDTVRAIEPYDATPHIYQHGKRLGKFAGYELRSPGVATFVKPPYAFWFAGTKRLGAYCDTPRLRAAFPAWLSKTAPMGLFNARRLYNWTQAVGVTVVRHPGGVVELPDGSKVPAAIHALRLGMSIQNGSIVEMSSRKIPSQAGGLSQDYEWDIDQREPRTGGKDINETVKDVDGEIWFAMGIPTEVIRAMESGSGFAGRSIPMETWFGGHDELARMVDQEFRAQVLHYGVKSNFGKTPWDYELSSLLDDFRNQNGGGGGPGGVPAPSAGPSGGSDGGGSDYRPDGYTDSGKVRLTNGTGQHRYSANLSGLGVPPAVAQAGAATAPVDKRTALLRRAAALAMIEHRLSEIRYSRPADHDARDALAELADDPDEVAAALGSVSLSWINYGKSRGGKQRWKDDQTGRVRYQDRMPGEFTAERKDRQGNAAKGHAIIDRHLRNEASADDLRELSSHVAAMTTTDLRRARAKLQATFKSAKQRDGMVKALTDHVAGLHGQRAAAEKAGADAVPKGPAKRADGTPAETNEEDVHTVPTASLVRRPEQMQYKVSGVGKEGITDELKGVKKYDPKLGGVLLTWRDPQTGENVVVNGHHRHELAERTGADKVNARFVNASSAKTARAIGAIANIAEGRGTATDAAKLMRDTGVTPQELADNGVSMTGRIAADAVHLKDLGDKPFQRLAEGRLNEQTAVAVAKHLKDPALQDLLFKKLDSREEDGKDWSPREIETAARKMAAAGKVKTQGVDLFGEFENEDSTFDQEVELEAHVGRALGQRVNDYAAVSNVGRADRVSDAGNVLATDENKRRREAAATEAETFHQLVNRTGPIADAIRETAGELAKATTKKEKERVKSAAVERVRKAVAAVHAGPLGGAASPDARGEGGSADVGPAAAVVPEQPAAEPTPAATAEVTPAPVSPPPPPAAPPARNVFAKPAAPTAGPAPDPAELGTMLDAAKGGGDEARAAFLGAIAHDGVKRDHLTALAKGLPIADAVRKLPKAKQIEAFRQHFAAAGTAMLSGVWNEGDRPRDRAGLFIDKDKIAAAQSDPTLADELRGQVRPEDHGKLERALGTPGDVDADHFHSLFKEHGMGAWDEKSHGPLQEYLNSWDDELRERFGDDVDTHGIRHRALHHTRRDFEGHMNPARPINKGVTWKLPNVLGNNFDQAAGEVEKERKGREFADTYFDHDDADDRVANVIENFVTTDEPLSDDTIPPDTLDAIRDDLKDWSADADEAGERGAEMLDKYGLGTGQHNAVFGAVLDALRARKPDESPDFDPDEAQNFDVFDLNELDGDERKDAEAFLTAAGVVPVNLSPGVYVVNNTGGTSPAQSLLNSNEFGGRADNYTLADTDRLHDLFGAVRSPRAVPEHHVPAAAKNTGTVSGQEGGGSDDFDPQAVDVYKRMNPDWFMVRRANNSPKAVENGGRYEFVRAADAPLTVRLPDKFWSNDAAAEHGDYDEDAAEKVQKTESGEAAGDRKRADEARGEYQKRRADLGQLRARHAAIKQRDAVGAARAEKYQALYDEAGDLHTDGDAPHHDAAQALYDAVTDLSSHADDSPSDDVHEHELGDPVYRRKGQVVPFDSRDEEADHLTEAVDEYDGGRDDYADALAENEQAFDEHDAKFPELWDAAAEKAKAVTAATDGDTTDEAAANRRFAEKVLMLHAQHARKLAKKAARGK